MNTLEEAFGLGFIIGAGLMLLLILIWYFDPTGDAEVEKESKWTPVTQDLPTVDGLYLTFHEDYQEGLFNFVGAMWDMHAVRGTSEELGITHWMPLPPAPASDIKEVVTDGN